MRIAARLGAFAAVLVAAFAVAAAVGSATHAGQPASARQAPAHHPEGMSMSSPNQTMEHAGHTDALPGGLAVAAGGYRLESADAVLAPGRAGRFAFRILGPDGQPVRALFPSPGAYRLFLQFKTAGHVHTAAYTLEVSR